MSILFKDSATGGISGAGYFRIGFVTLNIPPQNITTVRVVNNEKIATLRGMNEMFQKTGQSRWDVTATWTVLQNELDSTLAGRYAQWENLCNTVAIFKAAPFVEVESPHIRQIIAKGDPEASYRRMAFGLRQLRIETHPDIVDGLTVSLTMTYFNSMPFSLDFGYQGDAGQAVNADQSAAFRKYIAEWRRVNMDTRSGSTDGDPACPAWLTQTPGELALQWRLYDSEVTGQLPEWGGASMAAGTSATNPAPGTAAAAAAATTATAIQSNPALKVTPTSGAMLSPHFSQQQLRVNGASAQIIANAAYLCTNLLEPIYAQFGSVNINSGYRPMGQNAAAGGKTNSYHLYNGTEAAVDITCPATSLQILFDWIRLTSKLPFDKVILEHDSSGSQRCVHLQIDSAKAGVHLAYTGQTGNASTYEPQSTDKGATATQLAAVTPKAPATQAAGSSTSSQNSNMATVTDPKTNAAFLTADAKRLAMGWKRDHLADPGGVGTAFYYQEHELRVAAFDAASSGVQSGLFPTQMTVLFVNNLAQIPLAGYQYPTYQHLGPCSSLVQISFLSKGDRSDEISDAESTEPQHEDLTTLSSLAHNLEQQYQKMRTQFRNASSIHRMQAVYVENQVLNMLGIYGLMLDQVATQTVDDAADMATAQLTACQYENRFEELSPYRVNAIDGAYAANLQKMVLHGNEVQTAIKSTSPAMAKLLTPVTDYQNKRWNGDEAYLSNLLLSAATNQANTSPFASMSGAPTFTVNGDDAKTLLAPFMNKAGAYPVAVARVNQLGQMGFTQWTIVDYLMFKACAYDAGAAAHLTTQGGFIPSVNLSDPIKPAIARMDAVINAQTAPSRHDMVQDAYERLFPYFATTNAPLGRALSQLMESPAISKVVMGNVSPSDPALANADHGAYRDMGLNSMVLNGQDFNPAMYFVQDNVAYMDEVRKSLTEITKQIAAANAQVQSDTNSVSNTTNIPLSATTSIPGNIDSMMRMVSIPGYKMAEAFPTYKLFFMEDSSTGTYYAFDNFYSYSTILDIEVQRPWNKPATMQLKMTNLSYLFNHKLYDASLQGIYDYQHDKFATPEGGATGSDTPQRGFVTRDYAGGAPFQMRQEGPLKADGTSSHRRIPLQYYPLQTGSKIQLRMGYSNNPDDLTPVFCGQVTAIEGNEILTITAQSYLTELINPTINDMDSNGIFGGQAEGGITVFGNLGDAGSVIRRMLQVSEAKHWGRWQINSPATSLLKGVSWKESLAGPARAVGLSNLATALQSTYDRSGENIMSITAVQYDGSTGDKSYKDTGQRENPYFAPADYYIDASKQYSPWDLIQDVARRYPEFLLLEKWYGFPYSCNSTMVFGHPFNWYWARQEMVADQERLRALDKNGDTYKQWWAQTGAALFEKALNLIPASTTLFLDTAALRQQAGTGIAGLRAASAAALAASDSGNFLTPFLHRNQQVYALLAGAFAAAEESYTSTILMTDMKSSDILKPVRRYHLIDHQSIVHNGMSINDKIYNAVSISDGKGHGMISKVKANPSILDNYVRMLDVTDKINTPSDNVLGASLRHPSSWTTNWTGSGMVMAYSQSFLREEVGKMYRGEIVLRGMPEIEPMDILMVLDPSTGTTGPIEVDTVTHLMNIEEGFITIIKPRACVAVNEAASAAFHRLVGMAFGTALPRFSRLSALSGFSRVGAGTTAATYAAAGTVGLMGLTWAAPAATALTTSLVAGTSTAAALGDAAAVASMTTVVACPPLIPVIALAAILAVGMSFWLLDQTQQLYPLVLSPCSKFGRPWVGGIEGWSMEDLVGLSNNKAMQFIRDEVYPLLDAWRGANGYPPPLPPPS